MCGFQNLAIACSVRSITLFKQIGVGSKEDSTGCTAMCCAPVKHSATSGKETWQSRFNHGLLRTFAVPSRVQKAAGCGGFSRHGCVLRG
jgi:hypothetical protein